MRWELLQVFDSIHVLDLHGNTNKKERSPDGTKDQNVFDIMQGVSIIIASRQKIRTVKQAEVFHSDLWGTRTEKNEILLASSIKSISWTKVIPNESKYSLIPIDEDRRSEFEAGVPLDKLFKKIGNGIVTKRDELCIQFSTEDVWRSMTAFLNDTETSVRTRYNIPKDVRDWQYTWAKADVERHYDKKYIKEINYRPFDKRFILYTGNARGFVGWPVRQVMYNYLEGPNVGLLAPKATRDAKFAHVFVTDCPSEAIFLSGTTGSNAMNMPLYLYPDPNEKQIDAYETRERSLNYDINIFSSFCKAAEIDPSDIAKAGADFLAKTGNERPSELKLFDYIYGVLHSEKYRTEFDAFLKNEYPRVPYPKTPDIFRRMSECGEKLRKLHLMQSSFSDVTPAPFNGDGNDLVAAGFPKHELDKVFINPGQYFEGITASIWQFTIGGYQPAQKWLKDRRGRTLAWDDIIQYQKMINVLAETRSIMNDINLI